MMNDSAFSHCGNLHGLLAEYDPDSMAQMLSFMERFPFRLTTADSMAEAEKAIESGPFDFGIFGLAMEYSDGGFVLAWKFKKANPNSPLMIVTALSSNYGLHFSLATQEAREWIKADAILDREIRFEQLQSELYRLLKKRS